MIKLIDKNERVAVSGYKVNFLLLQFVALQGNKEKFVKEFENDFENDNVEDVLKACLLYYTKYPDVAHLEM